MNEAPPVLANARVRLRPLRESDLPLLGRWYRDPEVIYWLHASERPSVSDEDISERFGSASNHDNEERWIIETEGGSPVGLVRLLGIDRDCGRAELAIVIGESGQWGRGLGTEAIGLVLGYVFRELGLRRVHLITDADNGRGIRCYEKCGFRREGLLRAHRTRYGGPLDMIVMGVLREDWKPPVRG